MKAPKVSILIVNYNGKKWLQGCLDSLFAQTCQDFEIILVDNASSDDSVEFVNAGYPDVRIISNTENLGFAGGNNAGIKEAKGLFVLLMNNDTVTEPDYLERFLEAFYEIPSLGAASSKIVLMDDRNKLDLCGAYWTDMTFLYLYGFHKQASAEQYNRSQPVFSNQGVSMLIRKDVLDEVGFFDEDFWCYYEETDLCHRIWLAGYECWYYPQAVIYHAVGETSSGFENSFIQYHNIKNMLMSFIKNFEAKTLLRVVPLFITSNLLLSLVWLLQGKFKHSLAVLKALSWNVTNLKANLRKRKRIQTSRKITDRELFSVVKRNPRPSYYLMAITGIRNLERYED